MKILLQWLVTSDIPLRSIPWPVLFNVVINDLDDGLEYSLSKVTSHTKLVKSSQYIAIAANP